LEVTPNIEVRLHARVVDGHGDGRLEGLIVEDVHTGRREHVSAAALFVLIGADPHTEWLRNVFLLDDRGFVLTGRDLSSTVWQLQCSPLPFETSFFGIFAAGDVRYGSFKRVVGVVGEGSVTVGSVHQY